MGQCNAQTNVSPSGVAPELVRQSTAQSPGPCVAAKKELRLQTTPRGLELIKSCAKFYANGVGMAKPTVQLSHRAGAALNRPATRHMSASFAAKPSISTVAVMCSLILPSLALAAIALAVAIGGAGGPEVAGDAGVKATNPAITAWRNRQAAAAAETFSNAESDIIIHTVKTVPIEGAWDGETIKKSAEIAPTD
jgi:hypothetical protein